MKFTNVTWVCFPQNVLLESNVFENKANNLKITVSFI